MTVNLPATAGGPDWRGLAIAAIPTKHAGGVRTECTFHEDSFAGAQRKR